MVLGGRPVEGWACTHNNMLTWPRGEGQDAGWLQLLAAPGGTQVLGCLQGPADDASAPLLLRWAPPLLFWCASARLTTCRCLAACRRRRQCQCMPACSQGTPLLLVLRAFYTQTLGACFTRPRHNELRRLHARPCTRFRLNV